ncbi:MAG: acylphosphatase, partial [Chlamydiia bacterium]|nr:acylphosphatase [Chlamydiia bacterium]
MTGQTPPSTETLLIVKGTVQGVFFRATTKRLADR